ncbi:MAG: hypothetical protein ABFE07_28145 [Armatimonadia bacterium]
MGYGYDESLPSEPPFEWVEGHERIQIDKSKTLGVLAFGAYNACGLIGSEKGGVAVVVEAPERAVIATKDIPWKPKERAAELKRIAGFIRDGRELLKKSGQVLVRELQDTGYAVR